MRKPLGVSLKSLTDYLIFFIILVFLLQSVIRFFGSDVWVLKFFSLSSGGLSSGLIWTFLTYSFLHEGPFHLLFNIIGIHFISRNVEHSLDSRSYVALYLLSACLGALFWVSFNIGGSFLIGSSAFVMASLTYFCLQRPNQPMTFLLFFILPVTLKPKYLLLGVLGLELYGFLFSELNINNSSGIAHSAHLGGMIAGAIVYTPFFTKLNFPKFTFTKSSIQRKKFTQKNSYSINVGLNKNLEEEVDKILDKINENGFGSLTDEEKKLLEKAKSLFNGKNN
jgi:membrane associated rhomboid family serine protease